MSYLVLFRCVVFSLLCFVFFLVFCCWYSVGLRYVESDCFALLCAVLALCLGMVIACVVLALLPAVLSCFGSVVLRCVPLCCVVLRCVPRKNWVKKRCTFDKDSFNCVNYNLFACNEM